jgi:uncharacterized protein (TIGR02444 family)
MQADGDFWAFSLHLYGQKGVSDACLGLQDRLAADVNLVLFAVWLGASGHRLAADQAQTAVDAVILWQRDVVETLRGVRRRLKTGPAPAPSPQTEALREAVKASELAAEKVEQDTLQRLRNAWGLQGAPADPVTAAVANVASILRITASVPPGDAEADLICSIVHAAIPTATAAAVAAAVLRQIRAWRRES